MNLQDIILVNSSYTESNYAYNFDNKHEYIAKADSNINEIIIETAKEQNIDYAQGDTLCNECFDLYLPDKDAVINRAPKDIKLLASEMEAFALFYNAKREGKRAACLLTVVDVPKEAKGITAEERETSLNKMIELALEATLKI